MYHNKRFELPDSLVVERATLLPRLGATAVIETAALVDAPGYLAKEAEPDARLLACAELPSKLWHDAMCRLLDEGHSYE